MQQELSLQRDELAQAHQLGEFQKEYTIRFGKLIAKLGVIGLIVFSVMIIISGIVSFSSPGFSWSILIYLVIICTCTLVLYSAIVGGMLYPYRRLHVYVYTGGLIYLNGNKRRAVRWEQITRVSDLFRGSFSIDVKDEPRIGFSSLIYGLGELYYTIKREQGTMPASQVNVQPPYAAAPQPPTLPTPPKRRGLSPMFVVLLIVLALLVGGGGVFAYFVIIPHGTSITTNDPQQLYMQATSGAPTLNDPLNASNPNGWHSTSSNTCTFSGNALYADAPAAGSGHTTESVCVAPAAHFNDFAYQVQTTINRGNITGLAFRSDTSARVVYLFGISRTGTYILVGVTVDTAGNPSVKILAQGTSQAIQTGAGFSNLLTVIARGSRFDLYVNQQYLTRATDTTASGGVIGVFGENTFGGPLEVFFSSIKVWQL